MALFELIQMANSAFQKLAPTMESASRVLDITDQKSLLEECQESDKSNNKNYDIVFSNVSFSYQSYDNFQLKEINLKIPHKEFILIIGPSGSGKSTLGSLLMNFYRPNSGVITVGETNINNIGQYKLPEYISICEQRSHIFNETVFDNLAISNINVSDYQIERALRLSKCDNFLSLENIRKINGTDLSAGQQKRIAIARTIIADKEIMIFDEPFANLDDKTASEIAVNLLSLKQQKTIIIITHTFHEGIEKADRLIFLHNGRIEAEGNHSELKRQQNKFYLKCLNYS